MTVPPPREPVRISPLAVPFLFLSLLSTAGLAFFVGPWAGIWLLAELVGALVLAGWRPDHRDASVAAALGGVLGFAGVMLLALFRGIL